MATATRSTTNSYPFGIDIFVGQHPIQYPNGTQSLYSERQASAMIFRFKLQSRFPPTKQIITHRNSAELGRHRTADLRIFTETMAGPMSIRAQHQRKFSFRFRGFIDRTVYIQPWHNL